MNADQLIDKLTKAISHKYKEDKTSPNITVSALKKGYYCSVVRYSGAFARGKQVICHARADSLNEALKGLANSFVSISAQPKDPIQELNDLLVSPNDAD